MFDIGAPELFIVAVLAIIVVGPKDLPKLIRSVMGMVRKVREMGNEFQAGVRKMADEVELDAITRKLNEAGNIAIDDTKPDINPSAEFSEYDEFDYDEYDYDNVTGKYSTPKSDVENKGADDTGGQEEKTDVSIEDIMSKEKAPVTAVLEKDTKKVAKKATKPVAKPKAVSKPKATTKPKPKTKPKAKPKSNKQ